MSIFEVIVLWFYNTVMWSLRPLLLIKLRRRARSEPMYGIKVNERLGHYCSTQTPADKALIWVHAVSLGETRVAGQIMVAIRKKWPGARFLLTHSTATGWELGQNLLQKDDVQTWLPWDNVKSVRSFFHHWKPAIGLLIETEVWPQLLHQSGKHKIPMMLVNARLNERSQHRAQRWSLLARPAYETLKSVWAQTQEDAQRLRSVGALDVQVMGNLKFDVEIDINLQAMGLRWRKAISRPVVLLASSREGEELAWVRAIQEIRGGRAECDELDVLWLIVPRHPQRFTEVFDLLQNSGFRIMRRSDLPAQGPLPIEALGADVWLGDSMGEMQAYYHLASICVLGGSFLPFGGQNLIESTACGCPIIMGPHTYNFAFAADAALGLGAAVRVQSFSQALNQIMDWLDDPKNYQKAVVAAKQLPALGSGSTQRFLELFQRELRSGFTQSNSINCDSIQINRF